MRKTLCALLGAFTFFVGTAQGNVPLLSNEEKTPPLEREASLCEQAGLSVALYDHLGNMLPRQADGGYQLERFYKVSIGAEYLAAYPQELLIIGIERRDVPEHFSVGAVGKYKVPELLQRVDHSISMNLYRDDVISNLLTPNMRGMWTIRVVYGSAGVCTLDYDFHLFSSSSSEKK